MQCKAEPKQQSKVACSTQVRSFVYLENFIKTWHTQVHPSENCWISILYAKASQTLKKELITCYYFSHVELFYPCPFGWIQIQVYFISLAMKQSLALPTLLGTWLGEPITCVVTLVKGVQVVSFHILTFSQISNAYCSLLGLLKNERNCKAQDLFWSSCPIICLSIPQSIVLY